MATKKKAPAAPEKKAPAKKKAAAPAPAPAKKAGKAAAKTLTALEACTLHLPDRSINIPAGAVFKLNEAGTAYEPANIELAQLTKNLLKIFE